MKTFKQHLTEVKRTRQRALKLHNYMVNRFGGDENEIPFHDFHYDNYSPLHKDDKHMFDYHGEQDIPLKSIINGQQSYSHAGIKHYLSPAKSNVFADLESPIKVVKHDDGYVVHDGHHRMMSHKLLGRSHIRAHVYTKNSNYKDEE